jgi:hypothetical protein
LIALRKRRGTRSKAGKAEKATCETTFRTRYSEVLVTVFIC